MTPNHLRGLNRGPWPLCFRYRRSLRLCSLNIPETMWSLASIRQFTLVHPLYLPFWEKLPSCPSWTTSSCSTSSSYFYFGRISQKIPELFHIMANLPHGFKRVSSVIGYLKVKQQLSYLPNPYNFPILLKFCGMDRVFLPNVQGVGDEKQLF